MAAPAVAWFEVTGKDGASMQRFYGDLFDWKIDDAGDGSGYGLVQAGAKGIGGGLTFAFFADPEGHVVGLSNGAVQ